MEIFAKNLRLIRETSELKQTDMHEVIGVKRSTWNNWERNDSEPEMSQLIRISDLFRVRIDDLLRLDLSTDVQLLSNLKTLKKELKSTGIGTGNGTGNDIKYLIAAEPPPQYHTPKDDQFIASLQFTITTQKALIDSLNEHIALLKEKKKGN